MSTKKYYFISYAWKRRGDKGYNYENGVRDSNPLSELLKWKNYDEEMKLLFYTEITKEQYEMLYGNIE